MSKIPGEGLVSSDVRSQIIARVKKLELGFDPLPMMKHEKHRAIILAVRNEMNKFSGILCDEGSSFEDVKRASEDMVESVSNLPQFFVWQGYENLVGAAHRMKATADQLLELVRNEASRGP